MFRGGRGSARDVVVRRCGGVGYGAGDGDAGIATATQDAPLSGLGGGEESALSCRHSSDEDTVSVSGRF